MMRHTQQGFLTVVAIIFIVIIGFLGVAMAYMMFGSANATNYFTQAEKALYVTDAGFEETAHLLLNPLLTGTNARISCAAITGDANLTNTAVGSGTFTATTVASNPVSAFSTLSSALTSAATTIAVASTAGFAASGRLIIEREVINYGAISGNSFVSVVRGANSSVATPHASGAYASQLQCMVDVKAGIPSLAAATYQREINQGIPLQEGWAVGSLSGANFVFTRWNRPTEIQWNSVSLSSASAENLNGISMLSNAEGWAVGNGKGTSLTLLHWTGSSWASAALTGCSGENLTSVSAVYSKEAWATGASYFSNCLSGAKRYGIMHWNGASWTELSNTTTPSIPADNVNNQNLNSVMVIDATQGGAGTLGFAVGNGGIILQYNGTTWAAVSSPTTQNLFGVYIISSSEAWAVGAAGTIIKWNGTTWSTVSSPTATQLNSISMLDYSNSGHAEIGWAVGNAGVAVTYNGTSWSSLNTGSANNLLGVAMFFTHPNQDVWAVGAAGTIMHYNGTAWASVASGVTQSLNAISLIAPQQYPFAWREIFA